MGRKIYYVIRSYEGLADALYELASLIVENRAWGYSAGFLILKDIQVPGGGIGYSQAYFQSEAPLSVNLVEEAARHLKSYFDEDSLDEREVNMNDFITAGFKILQVPETSKYHTQEVVFFGGGKGKTTIINMKTRAPEALDDTPIGRGRSYTLKARSVKAVKSFHGNFTVGDPSSPLLSFPVHFYPRTRHSSSFDMATYVGEKRVIQSSTLKTAQGSVVDPKTVEKGYSYLNEIVTADKGVQDLMCGEFEGAERWPKAFELLATVPKIPPWIPMERTDVVVGNVPLSTEFIKCFSQALEASKMHAIARLSHGPRSERDGDKQKHKGKLELVVLYPAPDNQLFCSPLPFREDYKYYYRFNELPTEPTENEQELDDEMDDLVDSMTSSETPQLERNALIERVATYVRDKMVYGEDAAIPPLSPSEPLIKVSKEINEKSVNLMRKFGITERHNPDQAKTSDPGDSDWNFGFV